MKELSLRSSEFSVVNTLTKLGIVPVKEFHLRESQVNVVNTLIKLGIVPVKELMPRLSNLSDVNAVILLGMVPLRKFLLNVSSLKDINAPIVLGSVPRIPPQKDKVRILRKLPIDEGNVPFVRAPVMITSTLAKLADEVRVSQ